MTGVMGNPARTNVVEEGSINPRKRLTESYTEINSLGYGFNLPLIKLIG
jgi:hypothetical protein